MENQTKAAIHVYSASVPWPEQAKLQIAELQATVAAQTAEINRLIDRLDHLERMLHRYLNTADGTATLPHPSNRVTWDHMSGVALTAITTGHGVGYVGETPLSGSDA